MKKQRNSLNGWINLHKPLHLTSADAVNKVKWLLKPTKIGHAGTLDPLATGVLPLALGEGTKCINLLMDAKKTYEFSVTFGERRTTDDAEGEAVAKSNVQPTESDINSVLHLFAGSIMQVPPVYSALKVAGRRAYDLARAGEEVALAARPVTVYHLELLGLEGREHASTTPSPHPLPQGERASPAAPSVADNDLSTGDEQKALSPCGRGWGEGARPLRAYVPHVQEEQAQDRAQALRRKATDAETKLWSHLRGRRFDAYKFRRQHPIGRYIVDFVCLQQRLIVELDGGQHSENEQKDGKRTAFLEAQGFRVMRFWNDEALTNMDGVLQRLHHALAAPLTPPSPARGEGLPAAPDGVQAGISPSAEPLPVTAHFRAMVSKGTYIRSLGRDIAQALGSEGYISRLHRAAVGPFTDTNAISLDFLADSVHNAPPLGEITSWLMPLRRALDDIPALAMSGEQLSQLRHGQRVTLAQPQPDAPQLAVMHAGELVALARVERNQVIPTRLLNL